MLAGTVLLLLTVAVLAAVGGPRAAGAPVEPDAVRALVAAAARGARRLADLQDRRRGAA